MSEAPVLIIDDDVAFCRICKNFLAEHDIRAVSASTPLEIENISISKHEVLLLDVNIPAVTTSDFLMKRTTKRRPITIMISSQCDLETRLEYLKNGADFFFPKPLDYYELTLVIKRALSRTNYRDESKNWRLSISGRYLTTPTNNLISLTSAEFAVLSILFENAPNPVPREQLSKAVYNFFEGIHMSDRALEVMISRIRQRLKSEQYSLSIRAQRHVGYFIPNDIIIED